MRNFELTKNHIKLLRNANIDSNENVPTFDPKRPFGNGDITDDVVKILQWDVKKDEDDYFYDKETQKKVYEIMKELPTALQIVLSTGSFDVGLYYESMIGDWNKAIEKKDENDFDLEEIKDCIRIYNTRGKYKMDGIVELCDHYRFNVVYYDINNTTEWDHNHTFIFKDKLTLKFLYLNYWSLSPDSSDFAEVKDVPDYYLLKKDCIKETKYDFYTNKNGDKIYKFDCGIYVEGEL